MTRNLKFNPPGYILVSVVVITTVILIIGFYLADALFSEQAITRNQRSATTAFYLAEAGVQEAIWKIQYDNAVKNTFLFTTNGVSTFSHANALLSSGSYSVTITNSARATAVIESTGFYNVGTKQAQRRIKVDVVKANTPPPFEEHGAIYTAGATGNEDITFYGINLTITRSVWVEELDQFGNPVMVEHPAGSLISSRNIEFRDSTANIIEDIKANRNIVIQNSNITQGGVRVENAGLTLEMPLFDANAYRTLAQASNQLFSDTNDLFDGANSKTFNGIVYVDSKLTVDNNRSLTVNGMLISAESIVVGSQNQLGTVTINHVNDEPSGLVALHELTAKPKSIISIQGLVYVGDRFLIDKWDESVPASRNISIEGGILCRRFFGSGFEKQGMRNLNIDFDLDFINLGLGNPNETPVILTQHWEEEY